MVKINLAKKDVSALEGLTCLKDNVKIYVPSTYDVKKNVPNAFEVSVTCKGLASRFGGFTSYEALGGWVSGSELVTERVTVIECFASALNNHDIDYIVKICKWIKSSMKQEAVSMEINGKLYFI